MPPRPLAAVLMAGALISACGRDGARSPRRQPSPSTSSSPSSAPAATDPAATEPATTAPEAPATTQPAAPRRPGTPAVRLTEVAELDQPIALAVRAGDPALYVAEKAGRVRTLDGRTVLDLTGQVALGSEQGLLGLAFSPDGGRLYVNYTDRAGDTHVTEFGFSGGGADVASRRDVLNVDQPFPNHNGGNLVFGRDGNLWIGLGDGGSRNDPSDNAQNLGTLLGKMLRIDPRPSGDRPYGVPGDNPFVGRSGARPEIWAYGLRNPWRYSFDRTTGDLWIGDVGQNAWEELDFAPGSSRGGENYGWDRLEGRHRAGGDPPSGHRLPIHEYPLSGGNCAITAGYVYRGSKIPDLAGAHLFGDFCLGRVMALRQEGGRATSVEPLGLTVPNLSSFGEDAAGELYALSLSGSVFRIDPR